MAGYQGEVEKGLAHWPRDKFPVIAVINILVFLSGVEDGGRGVATHKRGEDMAIHWPQPSHSLDSLLFLPLQDSSKR
jgi:hypothetical protein